MQDFLNEYSKIPSATLMAQASLQDNISFFSIGFTN